MATRRDGHEAPSYGLEGGLQALGAVAKKSLGPRRVVGSARLDGRDLA